MAREGDFHIENHTARDKLTYESIMKGHVDAINIDGKTFAYTTKVDSDEDYHAMRDDDCHAVRDKDFHAVRDEDYHAVRDEPNVDLEFNVKVNSMYAH